VPAILQLKSIHKAYGARVIFDEASITLNSEQKAGFISRNGAGKQRFGTISGSAWFKSAEPGTVGNGTEMILANIL